MLLNFKKSWRQDTFGVAVLAAQVLSLAYSSAMFNEGKSFWAVMESAWLRHAVQTWQSDRAYNACQLCDKAISTVPGYLPGSR